MGFLQENLRWRIKSQEDVPIRALGRATSQMVHALLSNRKHPICHFGSGRYFTQQIVWSAGSGYTFVSLMFLQGPYFSTEGGPGTPQGKILVRTLVFFFFFVITYEYCWVQNNKVVVTVEFM